MWQRALESGVDAVVTFCTDHTRMEELAALVKANTGFLYFLAGIHSDNVKRNNEKEFQTKLSELRTLALQPSCVGVLASLDLTRAFASHYPQIQLLQSQLLLAAEIQLPVICQQVGAADRLAEVIAEFRAEQEQAAGGAGAGAEGDEEEGGASNWRSRVAVLFDLGNEEKGLRAFLAAGCFIMIDGALCDSTSEDALALRRMLPLVPLDRLLLASNSPLHTPQNIPDTYVRTTRNEPSNLPFVYPVIADAYNAAVAPEPGSEPRDPVLACADGSATVSSKLSAKDVCALLYRNAARFFQFYRSTPGYEDGAHLPEALARTAADDGVWESCATAGDAQDADSPGDGEGEEGDVLSGILAARGGGSHALDAIDEDGPAAGGEGGVGGTGVAYRCRVCRCELFTDRDVMPHDGSTVRPSANTASGANAALALTPAAPAADAKPAKKKDAGKDKEKEKEKDGKEGGKKKGGKGKRAQAGDESEGDSADEGADEDADDSEEEGGRGKKGAKKQPKAPKEAPKDKEGGKKKSSDKKAPGGGKDGAKDGGKDGGKKEAAEEEALLSLRGGEVAVERWHEAKGKSVSVVQDGACRMLLVDHMTWMPGARAGDEPEGSLCCPTCQSKIGQYNLAGLKCSCGLLVTPAFKIPKNRVDATLLGVDALEAALAAADLKERGGVLADDEEELGPEARAERTKKKSGLVVPVNKRRGK
jgi:Tat protein secretion system quality control protein TatD with DNase activity